jgi:hypothetical protein
MTAKDLLYKVLDYQHGWAARPLAQATPALLRLGQIEALQAAFGLSKQAVDPAVQVTYNRHDRAYHLNTLSTLDYLLQGEFLRDRPEEVYADLAQRARTTVCARYGFSPDDRLARRPHLNWLYNYLLHYRQALYNVSLPERGMLEGFAVGLLYGQELANRMKAVIQLNTGEIDDVLWELLDPTKRDIPTVDLTQHFGYRIIDFEAIDLAWRMEELARE